MANGNTPVGLDQAMQPQPCADASAAKSYGAESPCWRELQFPTRSVSLAMPRAVRCHTAEPGQAAMAGMEPCGCQGLGRGAAVGVAWAPSPGSAEIKLVHISRGWEARKPVSTGRCNGWRGDRTEDARGPQGQWGGGGGPCGTAQPLGQAEVHSHCCSRANPGRWMLRGLSWAN